METVKLRKTAKGLAMAASVLAFSALAVPAVAEEGGPEAAEDLRGEGLRTEADLEGGEPEALSDTLEASNGIKLLLESRSVALDLVAWPFEHVVQPLLGAALSPFVPPLEYFFDEDVPERATRLVTFGKEKNVQAFPYLVIRSGASSAFGAAYMQHSPSSPRRYDFSVKLERAVDLDWTADAAGFLLLPGDFLRYRTKFNLRRERDTRFYAQDGFNLLVSDSSWSWRNGLSWKIGSVSMSADAIWTAHRNRTDEEVHERSYKRYEGNLWAEQHYLSLLERGLHDNYGEWAFSGTVGQNFLESSHAPTKGFRWEFGTKWGMPEGYGEYLLFSGKFEHALLLGKKHYELSRKEHRENLRYFRKFSFDDAVRLLDPAEMQRLYLERKVLVNYVSWRRLVQMDDERAPFDATPAVGKTTPLRGYDGSRFRGVSALTWTLEYRFPLIRKVDGVFFDEYAYLYPGEEEFADGKVRNSWGLGVRVRNPEFYFFRAQLAFHGFDGIAFLMTIAPEFWR